MSEPTVTIVIPTYKRLHYLQEALPSALSQSYRNFEVIVSDDAASDEVANYVESLGDQRIRYRRNEKNLGIAMNNFAAFSEAKGKYITSLHDDDIWEPKFLETLVPPLESDVTLSVAFCDHYLIDEQGGVLRERTERNSRFFGRARLKPGRHQPFLKSAVVTQAIPMVMAAVFRKSILERGDYPDRIGGSYDHWLAYLAVKDGQACYYVAERLTRYRIHPEAGTALYGRRGFRDSIYVRSRFLQEAQLADQRDEIRNGLGVTYGKLALYFLSRHSSRRAYVFFKQAFTLMNRPKTLVALAVNALLIFMKRLF